MGPGMWAFVNNFLLCVAEQSAHGPSQSLQEVVGVPFLRRVEHRAEEGRARKGYCQVLVSLVSQDRAGLQRLVPGLGGA